MSCKDYSLTNMLKFAYTIPNAIPMNLTEKILYKIGSHLCDFFVTNKKVLK